jgi:hypothetical protein
MRQLWILSGLALVGCVARPVREPQFSACHGERVAIVTNESNRTVDIYDARDRILGSVTPGGQQEFILPANATYAYARLAPRASNWSMPDGQRIRFRYLCRSVT